MADSLGRAITPQRARLEGDLLPRFAARFHPTALVVNLGAGKFPYREHFTCRYRTADRRHGCADLTCAAEALPFLASTLDGVVFMGVFERLADPMQAIREIGRVLKPGGLLLFGAPGLDFEWRVERDRWRLTPGGVAHVLEAFRILEAVHIERVFHFVIAERPAVPESLRMTRRTGAPCA